MDHHCSLMQQNVGESRERPSRVRIPRIVHTLTVVKLRMMKVRRVCLPTRIRRHPLHAAVGVLNAQLRKQRGRRIAEVVRLLRPLQRSCVPSRRQRRPDRVLPLRNQVRHVVGLVDDPLAIVRPSRRQHLIAYTIPAQKHFVRAEGRGVKPRRLYRGLHLK